MRYVNTFATLGLTVALTLAFPQATSTTDDSTAITDAAAATDAALVPESGLSVSADEADAQGRGTAHVNNNCPFDVYVYKCFQPKPGFPNGGCDQEHKLSAHTGSYQETYVPITKNGQSIKIGKTSGEVQKPILQLEYTVYGDDNKISYDVSEVNGNPFGQQGFRIDSNNSKCPSPACHPPATNCPGVFKPGQPTSGVPHDCPIGSNIGVTLCTG